MTGPDTSDLAVVIPTMGRWDILARTLSGLEAQTAPGFEVIVVSDGAGPPPPALIRPKGRRFVTQRAAGPGAARNTGVRESSGRLVLFLGDDMVPEPDLVRTHLAAHRDQPDPLVAVLGRVAWHPEVANNRINRWMDDSATQFDYDGIEREVAGRGRADSDIGFGRFYSCNVSLTRSMFESVGGFDESFIFYYEDLDLGWRLSEQGMRLLFRPEALAFHLHAYDWAGLEQRFRGIALGEKLLAASRPEFEPFFYRRIVSAGTNPMPGGDLAERVISRGAPWAGRHVPPERTDLVDRLRHRTDIAYHRRLAGPFLEAWASADALCELREYLGPAFDPALLIHHKEELDLEAAQASDEATFYRTSRTYLYDLTAFAMTPTKSPYHADLTALLPPTGRILDFGCGIGSDGLRLADLGYEMSFADFDNPSIEYLRWRLARRNLPARVFDLDADVLPTDFDAVICFDVIEHVPDPLALLEQLETLGDVVMVNFLAPDPEDTHLHAALDVAALIDHAERRGLLSYRVHHGRSHLVAYRSRGSVSAWSSKTAKWRGAGRVRVERIGASISRAGTQRPVSTGSST